jgi:partner of Y14 and mago
MLFSDYLMIFSRVRKELKIRPGFTPQEDQTRFRGSRQQAAETNTLPKGHIVGWVAPSSESKAKRGGKVNVATSSGRSLDALASGEVSFSGVSNKEETSTMSKSAKKNARRTEKKKEDKQKALEDKIRAAWDEDSEDDIPRPAKKGQNSASSSTAKQSENDPSGSVNSGKSDDAAEALADKVADLKV